VKGIHRQLIAIETPQQNGIAERKNRHLLETTRTLLFASNLPTYLWEEVVRIANYLSNRVPIAALYHIILEEKYFGIKPNISHLRIFGSTAYFHIQQQYRNKLESKARDQYW
jgi:hypothetical protein